MAVSGLAIGGWAWLAHERVPVDVDTAAPVALAAATVDGQLAPLPQPDELAHVSPRDDEQAVVPTAPIRLASIDPEALLRTTPSAAPEPNAPVPLETESAPPISAVPLPVPRPFELRAPLAAEPPAPGTQPAPQPRTASLPNPAAPVEDSRSFLEKLLGIQPGPTPQPGVAIYDISARTVTMPNGETLEAHSGYGDKLDDPHYVHVPMRGATPPGVYDLKEREKLFHGVRALRMNPVGGSGAVYNRVGLLAHTFMLGPKGDSNGCVSFRDYDKFLQAYLRGEVQRLVVITGRGDALPAVAGQPGSTKRASLRDRDA